MESKVSYRNVINGNFFSCRIKAYIVVNTMMAWIIQLSCNKDLISFISGKCKFVIQSVNIFIYRADAKAQKNGPHRSVYWVKKKPRQEDGSIKGEIWTESSRYIGDWRDNCKEGFGIQFYKNGDKYEGMWAMDKKHGQGTYWRNENAKLRREYTGDWFEDKKHGRGTFFFKNSDRYDGYWVNGMP
jgi:hypothetical protein